MTVLESSIIEDDNGFRSLADDWNRLAQRTDPKSVFLRHEWADACWQWLKRDGCELRIVCVRRHGEMIGICPLACRRSVRAGVSIDELTGLAVPDNQEFSLLADPADLEAVTASLIDTLKSGDLRWDILSLEKLPTDLPATGMLQEKARASGFSVQEVLRHENPGINLEDDWAAYYGRRSRRLKKGNNLIRNRLKRDNKLVEVTCFDATAEQLELEPLIATLTKLSAQSWKEGTGLTLNHPGPAAFLACLSEHALTNGWFLVWLLTIDHEPVAMEYQLEFNGIVSGLRADYDTRFDNYSPGTLLNWRIIERLFEREAAYYALGPGSNPYKARWVEDARELVDIVIYGDSLRARGLGALELRIKPLAKRLLGRSEDGSAGEGWS